jgi:hypothetical protein
VAVVACTTLPGCASWERAGTDLAVVGTSPVTIPLDAVHDSLDWGDNSSSAVPILLLPFNLPLHLLKHTAYTVVYAGDLCFAPIYLLTTITPGNHDDLPPIELYSLSDGYPWKNAPVPALEE